ncbi:Vacuolar iron transporter 1 [Zea mays]|uniref:Vacuolar iron transporter n=1 Tax=Zea mays TaxID=4577 RepID=A0A1D6EPL4_MAIZE|nr:Vacuolar iron transporter 1 [Zea mays]
MTRRSSGCSWRSTPRSTSPQARWSVTSSSASPTASPYPPRSCSPRGSPRSPPAPSPWGSEGKLAAKSEADHYNRELQREQDEIDTVPVVTSLRNNPKAWLEFMMKFELGLEKPEPRRALVSAATIALSYVAGGLVPLLPYMFVPEAGRAMAVSVAVTLAALLFFGFVKGRFTGDRPFFSAVQTTVVGALASAAAYAMARAVQSI